MVFQIDFTGSLCCTAGDYSELTKTSTALSHLAVLSAARRLVLIFVNSLYLKNGGLDNAVMDEWMRAYRRRQMFCTMVWLVWLLSWFVFQVALVLQGLPEIYACRLTHLLGCRGIAIRAARGGRWRLFLCRISRRCRRCRGVPRFVLG